MRAGRAEKDENNEEPPRKKMTRNQRDGLHAAAGVSFAVQARDSERTFRDRSSVRGSDPPREERCTSMLNREFYKLAQA
jgi:hypothetical protein